MTKTNPVLKRIAYLLSALAIAIVPVVNATQTSAAQLTDRSVTIGSSVASATTTYTFAFTVPTTGTDIQSFAAQACDTASGTCTQSAGAAGFSSAGAGTLPSQPVNLGAASGWTSNVADTTSLRVVNSGNTTNPTGSQTVSFQGVTNPSATNSTFFLRLTTYSDAAWTTPIDTGVVAASTAGQITVNANVDETLTFTLTGATVNLSPTPVTTGATSTGTSTMSASTNASDGYSITVAGNTLTGPSGNIDAMASRTTSTPGSVEQFGINLKANTTPSVGTAVSGAGSGVAVGDYNVVDEFKFVSGNTVASATAPTNSNTFTVSYIANITPVTAPGAYTTTLTYVATPNF